jgi:hypothetical protein
MVIFYQSTSCGLSRVIDEFSSGAAELHSYTYIQPEPDFSMHFQSYPFKLKMRVLANKAMHQNELHTITSKECCISSLEIIRM